MVFPGSFLLPASQTLHPGCAGGSGKPGVQQQEDRTYPNKAYVHTVHTASPQDTSCTSVY